MDSLTPRGNVIVIRVTNRVGAIDPALLRPGRFEVLVYVPVPDAAGRREIPAARPQLTTLT